MAVTVTVMEVGECEEHLAAIVRERLGTKLRVLDAGCGRMWNWDLGDVDMHLTGIDEDAEALRLRVEVKKDLDEAIVGDLRTVPLDDEAYDLVHSTRTCSSTCRVPSWCSTACWRRCGPAA